MNKLTKLLSVFVIAGAIGTGIAGAAGCAHKHTYEEKWTPASDGSGHYHVATCHPEEHDELKDHVYDDDKDTTCNDCGYVRTIISEKLEIAADVTGLVIEGVGDTTVNLSSDKKSHDIVKGNIKVYFAKGASLTKGDEVPAANLELTLKDPSGADCTEWTGLKKNGAYTVYANIKDAKLAAGSAFEEVSEVTATATVTVNNEIVGNTLALKEGTVTQKQSAVDSMTSTWKFEVSRKNGDKVAVETVSISGVVTSEASTDKKATVTATVEGVACSCEVAYTITVNEALRIQSYAYNFGVDDHEGAYQEDEYLIDSKSADHSGTYVMIPGSGETANGVKNDGAKPRTSKDGEKFFATRITFGGGTYTSKGAFDSDETKKKYIEIKTESAGKVTVYWSRNSSADNRGLALWKKEDALAANIGNSAASSKAVPYDFKGSDGKGTAPEKLPVGVVSNIGTGSESLPEKFEFTVPEAGTYYLTTATNQAVYLYYIQVDNEYPNGGVENVVVTPGNKVLSNITVSHTTAEYKQAFDLGGTFSVDTGYTFKGISVAENTAALTEDTLAVSDLEFYLGTTKLTPGETVLDATLIPETGDKTITVKKGDITATYTINVASALGVDRVTAALKSDVTTEVENASAQISILWANFNVTTVGTNENVDVAITAASYVAKDAPAGTEGTAIAETGTAIGVGSYVVTLTVQVTDKTNTSLTKEFTATCNLNIQVAGSGASWLYQTENSEIGASNPGLEASGSIADNSCFTAISLDVAQAGYNRNSAFETNIKDSANTVEPGQNKPIAAAEKTAGGEAITFTNALSFNTKPGASGKGYIQITAKKATRVYVYLNASDDGHKSNRSGSVFYYSLNGTDCATADEVNVGNRRDVPVLEVALSEGDVLIVKAKQGTATSDPRIWFYGIEAV